MTLFDSEVHCTPDSSLGRLVVQFSCYLSQGRVMYLGKGLLKMPDGKDVGRNTEMISLQILSDEQLNHKFQLSVVKPDNQKIQ